MRAATETMDRAGRSMSAPLTSGAPLSSRTLGDAASTRATASSREAIAGLGITAETPITEAAALLAEQIRRVPGAQNHAALRLAELETRGPRAMRLVWNLAKPRLGARYGAMTVGDLLAGYPEGTGPWRLIERDGPAAPPPA